MKTKEPCPDNRYQAKHVDLLLSSYHHWTGKDLISNLKYSHEDKYLALFTAPSRTWIN